MKTIEYKYINKTTWSDGPWQTEPDKVQFQDETTGMPCLVVRTETHGGWCGYVGVTEEHPLFENSADWDSGYELLVHGGITFSGFCVEDNKEHGICHVPDPGEPDHVWWLGFDCAHCNDVSPAMDARYKGLLIHARAEYRELDYVKAQCSLLALQLKDLEKKEQAKARE